MHTSIRTHLYLLPSFILIIIHAFTHSFLPSIFTYYTLTFLPSALSTSFLLSLYSSISLYFSLIFIHFLPTILLSFLPSPFNPSFCSLYFLHHILTFLPSTIFFPSIHPVWLSNGTFITVYSDDVVQTSWWSSPVPMALVGTLASHTSQRNVARCVHHKTVISFPWLIQLRYLNYANSAVPNWLAPPLFYMAGLVQILLVNPQDAL